MRIASRGTLPVGLFEGSSRVRTACCSLPSMSNVDYAVFLPRRLSHPGCVAAGTQLATHHEALKKELKETKVKLSPKVEAAVARVIERTHGLEHMPSSDATMMEIDRGTDRNIAGMHDQLDAIERSFDHAWILPLSDADAARLADASLVRSSVLPAGTSFLKLVYSRQWAQMSAMMKALSQDDVAAAVKRLGLGVEVARLSRWVDLYGAKLGLTERKAADPSVAGVEEWHDAYGELLAHVHSEYNDRKDDTHAKIRDALLSPYNTQADEERRADQKRAKRKDSGAAPAPTDQPS
jgi:hypothetical protein